MYSDGYSYRPPPRPRPNYALRRLVAATGLLVVLWLLWQLLGALFGGGGGGDDVATGSSTTIASTTPATVLERPPPCTVADDPTIYGRPEDWERTILDPQYAVDEFYEPPDLVSAAEANYAAEYQIRSFVAADLNSLRNGIISAGVPEAALLAGYRSVATQRDLYNARVAELGEEAAAAGTARAGHSEHHLGTTVDFRLIGESDVDQSFGDTPTGQWLAQNSWQYGFVLSYPEGKESVTCYKYEPWHFRYVGVALAARVQASGLTLREYLWHWEVTGVEPGQSAATTTTLAVPTESVVPSE